MFDEKLLYTPEFDALDSGIESVKASFEAAGLVYPEFVTSNPEKDIHVIFWKKDLGFTSPNIFGFFEDIEEIYDHIEKTLNSDAEFDKSTLDSGQIRDAFLGYTLTKKSESGGHRMLLGPFNYEDSRLTGYINFLQLAKRYIAEPDNVVLAYEFIQYHPAFWYRYRDGHKNDWSTEDGHKSVWVYPTFNKEGNLVVMLEHGSTVSPEYKEHYHDFRLDVWGTSFEDAYVQLAKLVHKFFYLDGSERPDVPYAKSDLEIELKEIMSSLDEDD